MQVTSFPNDFSHLRVHFVGIKGTGMAALVELLHARGALITGSDVAERFYTDAILEKLGICAQPFSENNISRDIALVIYSSAYNVATNPDLIAATKLNLPCMLYTEALGALSRESYSAGICGVHGKTSTAGLTGSVLSQLDLPVQVLAGSVISSFAHSCTLTTAQFCKKNKLNYFVAETCEYQNHFLSFFPQKIVLTSVESDHQDFFPTYESIQNAFINYICKLPQNGELIYCADDKGAKETALLAKKKRKDIVLIPYGEKASGGYRVTFGGISNGAQHFTVDSLGEFLLHVPGHHEVLDAAAALALSCELLKADGKDVLAYTEKLKDGIALFRGGKRRSEVIGRKTVNGNDIIFMDDYAHHPTAIKTTLAGYREFYQGRKIIVDFMSHTYTRTAALLEEFASSFESADEVILHKIYASARENAAAARVTGVALFDEVKKRHDNVHYFEEWNEAKDFVRSELASPNDFPNGMLFVTMGAGDNWQLGKSVYEEIRA
ncbi:MAG: UDP-N-acetylmuramate--L-alanine ligase [Treponema sp.]|nr:UDP-N-acetylmuramate--L-alanine ligase [Treponema sp.]